MALPNGDATRRTPSVLVRGEFWLAASQLQKDRKRSTGNQNEGCTERERENVQKNGTRVSIIVIPVRCGDVCNVSSCVYSVARLHAPGARACLHDRGRVRAKLLENYTVGQVGNPFSDVGPEERKKEGGSRERDVGMWGMMSRIKRERGACRKAESESHGSRVSVRETRRERERERERDAQGCMAHTSPGDEGATLLLHCSK